MFSRLLFRSVLGSRATPAAVGAVSVVSSVSLVVYAKQKTKLDPAAAAVRAGMWDSSLPSFTKAQVAEHNSPDKGLWVVYKDGVYDISEFVAVHPGGNRILLAAGKSIEPFWALYAAHNSDEVREVLEKHRIGNLVVDANDKEADINDPYAKEPTRNPALFVLADKPFNAETPPELLVDSYLTPNDWFFVRNHLPVPADLNEKNWAVDIDGEGIPKKIRLDLKDLHHFPKHTVTTTMSCAGNRRREMQMVGEVKGLSWTGGGIGTASWSGAKLSDVLESAGFNFKSPHVEHFQFEGYDEDPTTQTIYGASIPADIALHPKSEVILAYEMNGEKIPTDHGHPVRLVVPGVAGARNVKWLKSITPAKKESPSHWQQHDYKTFSPGQSWKGADFTRAVSIQETPVTSFICDPVHDAHVYRGDDLTLRGYAVSGGGKSIIRVDVSPDGGKQWTEAEMLPPMDNQGNIVEEQALNRAWAWRRWECNIPVETEAEKMQVCVKATDSANNTQPEGVGPIWNLRGLLNNSWHCLNVNVKDY